ncbi:hypothetical protein KR067_012348, partial [Drosophila pandora]
LQPLALCCMLVVHIKAQDPEGRRFCDRLTAECVRHERQVGTVDDTVTIYNNHCRRTDRTWRNITRCELVRASCICKFFFSNFGFFYLFMRISISVTMVRCDNPTCKNVADSLRS